MAAGTSTPASPYRRQYNHVVLTRPANVEKTSNHGHYRRMLTSSAEGHTNLNGAWSLYTTAATHMAALYDCRSVMLLIDDG
jgi:hypothetical protein